MRALYSLEWLDEGGWYLFDVYTSRSQARSIVKGWRFPDDGLKGWRIRKWVRA